MRAKQVVLKLSGDEALVFYDWLMRFNQREAVGFADQAEERVLFDLETMLEKELVPLFQADYTDQLTKARLKVRDENA